MPFQELSQTGQHWTIQDNGKSLVFNTPASTGQSLIITQGEDPQFSGTCGIVACANLLRLAGLKDITEEEVLSCALDLGRCTQNSPNSSANGRTNPIDRQAILRKFELYTHGVPPTIEAIAEKVCSGYGVIITVCADVLRQDSSIPPNDPHAVVVTSVKYDQAKKKILGFFVCDSTINSSEFGRARYCETEILQEALYACEMNVTNNIIR